MREKTFGPWAAIPDNAFGYTVVAQRTRYKEHEPDWEPDIYDANICMSIGDYTEPALDGEENRKAIAHLIAAAPELLAALEGIMAIVSESSGVIKWSESVALKAAVTAIKKARGENKQ